MFGTVSVRFGTITVCQRRSSKEFWGCLVGELLGKISGTTLSLRLALMQKQDPSCTPNPVKWPRRIQAVAWRHLHLLRDLSSATQLDTCHWIIEEFQQSPKVFLRHKDSCFWCLLKVFFGFFLVLSSSPARARCHSLINCQKYQRPNNGSEGHWAS